MHFLHFNALSINAHMVYLQKYMIPMVYCLPSRIIGQRYQRPFSVYG